MATLLASAVMLGLMLAACRTKKQRIRALEIHDITRELKASASGSDTEVCGDFSASDDERDTTDRLPRYGSNWNSRSTERKRKVKCSNWTSAPGYAGRAEGKFA